MKRLLHITLCASASLRLKSGIAIAAAVLFACQKDEPKLGLCFPATSTSTSAGASTLITFAYLANNKVSTLSSIGSKVTFTYDVNGKLSKSTSTSPFGSIRTEYAYNQQNQLTKSTEFDDSGADQPTIYEYNATGQLIKKENNSVRYSETYEYASPTAKNILRAKSYGPGGIYLGTTEYEYDDKKSPFTNLGIDPYLTHYSENNELKETYTTNNGNVTTTTFVYQYNDQGYPLEYTKTTTLTGGQTLSINLMVSYSYNCK